MQPKNIKMVINFNIFCTIMCNYNNFFHNIHYSMFEDNTMLILFVIMLLGLILCSFLGGDNCCVKEGFGSNNSSSSNSNSNSNSNSKRNSNSDSNSSSNSNSYDNYNHYTGESYPSIFYSPNGATAKIIQSDSGNIISITDLDGDTKTLAVPNGNGNGNGNNNSSVQKYTNSDGSSATIITDSDGNKAIQMTDSNNTVTVYSVDQPTNSVDNMNDSERNDGHTVYNSNDNNDNTNAKVWSNNNDNNNSSCNSNNNNNRNGNGNNNRNGNNNNNRDNGPRGNVSSSSSNKGAVVSNNENGEYDQYLPPGIPRSEIPAGDEDLYILKSQVVPPVCPSCNSSSAALAKTFSNKSGSGSGSEKCPPCPACDRCPEPAYDCKLVPNYGNYNSSLMPAPVLSSFTSFGM